MQFSGIGSHLVARGKSHDFSQVAVGIGVHSRVKAGMAIQNLCLFSDVRTAV